MIGEVSIEPADAAPDLDRPVSMPLLPWLAAGLVAGCLGLPPPFGLAPATAWWVIACPALLVVLWLRLSPVTRGLALALVAWASGMLWAPVPQVGPALVEIEGRVDSHIMRRFDQGFTLDGAAARAQELRYVRAPNDPAVLAGDRVRLRGLLAEESWSGRPVRVLRAVDVKLLQPREEDWRGPAWRALAALDERQELAGALLLGQGRPPEHGVFRRAGLLHLLAVSGLHLGLALGAVALLLRHLPLPWGWRRVGLLAAAAGYALLTGLGIATQRAALMAGVLVLASLLRRRLHPLAGLSLAVVVLLLIDPGQARSLGFQLSAAAVAGIVTLGRGLIGLRRCHLPLTPWPLDRPSWRGLLALARGLCDGLAIGLAATVAVTPILAITFGRAYPWSPLATLLATPPLVLALVAGLCWLLAEMLWSGGPWAGLMEVTRWGLDGLWLLVQQGAAWPGAELTVTPPPPAVLLAWPLLFAPLRDRLDLGLRGVACGVLLLVWAVA